METVIQPRSGGPVCQVALRLPVPLRDQIKGLAGAKGQSVNTFIVQTLREKTETEN